MITWSSRLEAEVIGQYGDDEDVARAAWVSTGAEPRVATHGRVRGVIRSLMRDRHGTPFEDGFIRFRIVAPRAVRDEHVRHRIGSYSSSSLRYRAELVQGEGPRAILEAGPEDDPSFYIPPPERPLKPAEGHKQIRPAYEFLGPAEYQDYHAWLLGLAYEQVRVYNELWKIAPATEAVRWATGDNLYTPYIARFNPRQLMHFLALRTHDERANHVSWPMWEIEQVARQMEAAFELYWPVTYEAWQECGREAP